jgi:hypothetical protein
VQRQITGDKKHRIGFLYLPQMNDRCTVSNDYPLPLSASKQKHDDILPERQRTTGVHACAQNRARRVARVRDQKQSKMHIYLNSE